MNQKGHLSRYFMRLKIPIVVIYKYIYSGDDK